MIRLPYALLAAFGGLIVAGCRGGSDHAYKIDPEVEANLIHLEHARDEAYLYVHGLQKIPVDSVQLGHCKDAYGADKLGVDSYLNHIELQLDTMNGGSLGQGL